MPRSDKAAFLWSRAVLGAALPCVPIETRGVDSEGMAWLKDIGSRTKYVPRKQTRRRDRIKANLLQLTGFKLIVTSDLFLTVFVDEYAKSRRCTGCVVIADHLATGHWPLDTSH